MICERCGAQLPEGAKFCNVCGAPLEAGAAPAEGYGASPAEGYGAAAEGYGTAPAGEWQGGGGQQPVPLAQQPDYSQYGQPAQPGPQDELTRPLTMGEFVVNLLIAAIPCVGWIFIFVCAFSTNININRRNWARAMLVMVGVGIVLAILLYAPLISAIMRY